MNAFVGQNDAKRLIFGVWSRHSELLRESRPSPGVRHQPVTFSRRLGITWGTPALLFLRHGTVPVLAALCQDCQFLVESSALNLRHLRRPHTQRTIRSSPYSPQVPPTRLKDAMSNDDERNVIREALELEETKKFGGYLHQHVDDIKRIIAHHFRLNSKEDCEVSPVSQWKHGGFNISIPVHILSPKKKLMFRCPMAHKLAEIPYPGTVNEKSRAEVATKIWLRRNCPSLSTAHLYGFQYPDGRHVSSLILPGASRLFWFSSLVNTYPLFIYFYDTSDDAFANT